MRIRRGHDIEGCECDSVGVVGAMCVVILAPRFVRATIGRNGRLRFPLEGAVACNKGQDRVLGGAHLNAICLSKQGDGAMGEVASVDAETAVKEGDEHESSHGEAERETEQAMTERP